MYRQDPQQQAQELAAIRQWREGKDSAKPDGDLVGLALSGGGIRSATFGLGVLERLREIGLLQRVDYLSTVSGGGYIGGWLSVNCLRREQLRQQPTAGEAALPWLSPGANWDKSIAHLRRYSKYLSPEVGLLSADTWTMGTIWLRNALLTQTIIVLMIAALMLLARVLHKGFVEWPMAGDWRWIAVVLFSAAAGGIARNQRQLDAERGKSPPNYATPARALASVALIAGTAWLGHRVPGGLFTDNANSPGVIIIALMALSAGYYAMPFVEHGLYRLQARLQRKGRPTVEADYGQGAVQRFVIVPMVAVGFLLGAVLWGQSSHKHGDGVLGKLDSYGGLWTASYAYWELSLVLAFGSLSLFACRSTRKRGVRRSLGTTLRQSLVVILATACSGLVLHSLMVLIMLCLNGSNDVAGASWSAMVWAPPAILFSFSMAVVMLIGIQGVDAIESVREWWSRMGAWLCIYGMAWMIVLTASVYGPLIAAWLLSAHSWTIDTALLATIATTIGGVLAGKSGATGTKDRAKRSPLAMLLNALALLAPILLIAALLIGVSTAVHLVTAYLASDFTWPGFAALGKRHWQLLQLESLPYYSELMLGLVVVALLIMAWRVDINEFSLNAFYRNRLARCYLGATRFEDQQRHAQRFIGFDPDDDLPLADLGHGATPQAGPFHIFNCALNLGGSSDLSVHTRHGASFALTPHFVGSHYQSGASAKPDTGLSPTGTYGGAKQPLTVAKAMAVSGAAASPNMGFHTSPLVAFALTFFNVRLGWWFPTGRKATQGTPAFGLTYLIKEMLGLAGASSDFLMISDGGHFENLGAYELVGRRCQVIIVSDAECDPDFKFEGLGNLIRMCKVDHGGTAIDIDVRPIIDGKQTHTIGTIHYPAHELRQPGLLVYLKAAMTGDEGAAVLQYQASHSAFPHESTGNQFYGEDQFESYRTLGYETTRRAMTGLSFASGEHSTAQALMAALGAIRKTTG